MLYYNDSPSPTPANRTGSGSYWEVYRQARRDVPDLCDAMYGTIVRAVESELNRGEKSLNSTRLGRQILNSWHRKDKWDTYFANKPQRASGSLFGEIMKTVMCDDPRDWIATQAQEGRTYSLR